MSKRRRFSREFKLDVVRMVTDGGHSVMDVSKDLELRPEMWFVAGWVNIARTASSRSQVWAGRKSGTQNWRNSVAS